MNKKKTLTLIGFVAIIATAATISIVRVAARASDTVQILAYGIEARKFEEPASSVINQRRTVARCVFFPISNRKSSESSYPQQEEDVARTTVSLLKSLTSYRVYRSGKRLDIRYADIRVSATDLPAFFATSAVPKNGCGEFLITSERSVAHVDEPTHLSTFREYLLKNEEALFINALRDSMNKLPSPQREDVRMHELAKTFRMSGKSEIRPFFDGKSWFLVRSYSIGVAERTGVPSWLNALIIFRSDKGNGPQSILVHLDTKDGRNGTEFVRLRFIAGVDLDGDGVSEMLVQDLGGQLGSRFPGRYSYLQRSNQTWQ